VEGLKKMVFVTVICEDGVMIMTKTPVTMTTMSRTGCYDNTDTPGHILTCS